MYILQYSRVFHNFPSLAKGSINKLFEFVSFLSAKASIESKQYTLNLPRLTLANPAY